MVLPALSLLPAAGAAAGGAAASSLPGILAGAGMAAGGLGSLIGGITGSSSQPAGDYASLYATQLAPGQTALTLAAQQVGALMGPYIGGLNTATSIYGSNALTQLQGAYDREKALTDTYSKAAQEANSAYTGALSTAAGMRSATEFLGPSTAANLANLYGQATSAMQNKVLESEGSAANTVTQSQALAGLNANQARNKMVSDLQGTNLDIRKMQEDTLNKLALQRGQTESQMALKRMGAGYALAGAQGFA